MGSSRKALSRAAVTASGVASHSSRSASHRRATSEYTVVSVIRLTCCHRLGSARPVSLVRVESMKSMPRRFRRVSKSAGSSASRSSIRNPWTWLSMTSASDRSIRAPAVLTVMSVLPAMGFHQGLVVQPGEGLRLGAPYRDERVGQHVPHRFPEDLRFLQVAHSLLHRLGQPPDRESVELLRRVQRGVLGNLARKLEILLDASQASG